MVVDYTKVKTNLCLIVRLAVDVACIILLGSNLKES